MTLKIALDAMGGDLAPRETVLGAVAACREFNAAVILTGIPEAIERELAGINTSGLQLEIEPAMELVAMDDHPVTAVRRKKNSSLAVANRLVKEGRAAGVISAGNTGAAMASSHFTLGLIEGIKRSAIATPMPTLTGVSVLLDAGANADCEPENLLQFAQMGAVYAEFVFGIVNPRVALLSIGEEETKGNKLTVEAHQLLKDAGINFIGNVEGRDVHRGVCDVTVCDGFVGNTILKLSEGLSSVIFQQIKEAASANLLAKIGGLLLRSELRKFKARMDYTEYGGAPLLGINGISMISHGSSNAKAIKNAIRAALRAANEDVVGKIARNVR